MLSEGGDDIGITRKILRGVTDPPVESGEMARSASGDRFGGTVGNEILTSAAGLALVGVIVVEVVTIIDIAGLTGTHMFIGLVLIPLVILKLGTTGYRAVRYYSGSVSYRALGTLLMLLRVIAPLFVAATLVILVTGVVLMADGHKAGSVLEVHKVSFIVWVVLLGVHLLAYFVRALRLVLADLRVTKGDVAPGIGIRTMLLVSALGGGVALASALLPTIDHSAPLTRDDAR